MRQPKVWCIDYPYFLPSKEASVVPLYPISNLPSSPTSTEDHKEQPDQLCCCLGQEIDP